MVSSLEKPVKEGIWLNANEAHPRFAYYMNILKSCPAFIA